MSAAPLRRLGPAPSRVGLRGGDPGKQANRTLCLMISDPAAAALMLAPINAADKRIVNGKADINQLAPFKYPWAWEFFLKANRNHWTPLEIGMAQDVHDYHHKLSAAERHVFENVLAYLTTSDILAMRNIGLAVMEKMSAPELQIYQARQVYEEALHTWTYQHCIESLGLDQQEIYNRYRVVPEIHGKIALANRRLEKVLRSDFDLTDRANLHEFALSYFFFAVIFEGCWFYNGFTPVFALQRRGLMKGAAEQLQYIMRDEVLHCAFGIRVIRELLIEENLTLDPAALRELWDEAEAAETAYAGYILREPILGYNADLHVQQFRFIANRRARQVGVDEPFPRRRKRPALARRAGQPAQGEELLRNAGYRVSNGRCVDMVKTRSKVGNPQFQQTRRAQAFC